MLCDVCKCNDATVFLTQILEGKMQKVNLCDACSKEKGVQDPTGFALADLLLGIGAAEEIEKRALEIIMKISNMLATAGEWLRGEGPHHQIVISSRVRLARNLRNRPFPGWAKKAERSSILELIRSRVATLPEMQEAFAESL